MKKIVRKIIGVISLIIGCYVLILSIKIGFDISRDLFAGLLLSALVQTIILIGSTILAFMCIMLGLIFIITKMK